MDDYYDFGYGDADEYGGSSWLDSALEIPDFDIGDWWDSQAAGNQGVLDEILTGGGGDFAGTLKDIARQAGK
jgi:hypothetical protein